MTRRLASMPRTPACRRLLTASHQQSIFGTDCWPALGQAAVRMGQFRC